MNKLFFTPEDFYTKGSEDTMCTPQKAADIANAKIAKKGLPVFTYSTDRRYWTDPNDSTTQGVVLECDIQGFVVNIQKV